MIRDFMAMPNGNLAIKRMLALLERGLVVHGDCSGKMTPEQTIEMLDVGLRLHGAHLPEDWLVLWRTCDTST